MSIEQFLPLLYILCFFIIIMLFDSSINYLMQNSFVGYRYRFFVAPGVIVHELSHALAAKLTFHKIKKISLFDPDGGYVIHEKTREPVSQVIISFAPIVGISLAFLICTYLLQPEWLKNLTTYSSKNIILAISHTSILRWQTWLHLYLSVSLATSLAPSRQDFKVAFTGIVFILLIIFLFALSSLQPTLMTFLMHFYLISIFIVIFLSLALLISFLFYFITKLANK